MKRLIVVSVLLALGSLAYAATKAPPPEVAKTLEAFNGKWTLETTMTPPGGKPVKFEETINCRLGAQGHSAICVDRFTAPGEGPTEYNYLVGYDGDTKSVHLFAVGSRGEVHDHRCNWTNDKVLECAPLAATLGGQPITEAFVFTFDENKLTLKGTTVTTDGTISFEAKGSRSSKYSLGHWKSTP
jgi:hypothetical protein